MPPPYSLARPLLPSGRVCPRWLIQRHSLSLRPARLSCALRICSARFQSTNSQSRKSGKTTTNEANRAGRKLPKGLALLLGAAILVPSAVYVPNYLSRTSSEKIFDPPRFTTFTVTARESVSPTSVILTLRPNASVIPADPYRTWWEKGTWSVEFKQPELQVARSYTPLPPTPETVNGDLRFLIRKEFKGEVSGYLHTLREGDSVQLRGPHAGIDLPSEVSDVVFLAGGTGIAPAMQIVYTLLELRKYQEDCEKPRVRIVWANRRREDCVGGQTQNTKFWKSFGQEKGSRQSGKLVLDLEALQKRHGNKLVVDYVVDEEGSFIDQKKMMQLVKTNSEVKFGPRHEKIDKKLIFVSGPEGFVQFFAGPKKWEGGKEGQGEIGGMIGKMRLREWKVWKL